MDTIPKTQGNEGREEGLTTAKTRDSEKVVRRRGCLGNKKKRRISENEWRKKTILPKVPFILSPKSTVGLTWSHG